MLAWALETGVQQYVFSAWLTLHAIKDMVVILCAGSGCMMEVNVKSAVSAALAAKFLTSKVKTHAQISSFSLELICANINLSCVQVCLLHSPGGWVCQRGHRNSRPDRPERLLVPDVLPRCGCCSR